MDPRATSSSAKGCSARPSVAVRGRWRLRSRLRRRRFVSHVWARGAASTSSSVTPSARRSRQAMVAATRTASRIPAGFTYLGQFVDHDLTFDKTSVMLGENVSPAQLLQARSPSLDLDSLYGAGPNDPASEKFYEADGVHLKMGKTDAVGGIPAKQGFDLPRGAGSTLARETQGDHPRPAQRREPRRRATPPRVHPLPQPRRRHAPLVGAAGTAIRAGAAEGRQALPVDAEDRLPAEDLRAGRGLECLQPGPKGLRGGRRADRRADDADRVLGGGLPARSFDDPRRVQLEPEFPDGAGDARPPVRVLGRERKARRRPAPPEQLDRGLPAAVRLRGGTGGEAGFGGAHVAVQPRDANRHEAREHPCRRFRASRRRTRTSRCGT